MSGSHYQISYSQILETECRLQLSNILKMFAIKSDSIDGNLSLREYLSQFAHTDCTTEQQFICDADFYINRLNDALLPELDVSQIECLIYVAGYAVFSYFKKFNGCRTCHDFLTTNKPLVVLTIFGVNIP